MEVYIIRVSPPGFLSIPIHVSLSFFLNSSPCPSLPQPVHVWMHLFLLCQFLISHSERVYCASQICIQYSKITQIQSSIGGKGKEKHKVGSEMRPVRKCRLWNLPTSYRCHKFSLCSLAVIPKMEIQFSGRKIKLYQLLKLPKSA